MKHTFALLVLGVAMSSCAKQADTTQTANASDAIVRAYTAVNNKDTAAFLASLTTSARQRYTYNPKQLAADLAYWSANHFEVQVLNEEADSVDAVVTFHVKTTGKYPEQTTPAMLVQKEGGVWKVADNSMYSADRIPEPERPVDPDNKNC